MEGPGKDWGFVGSLAEVGLHLSGDRGRRRRPPFHPHVGASAKGGWWRFAATEPQRSLLVGPCLQLHSHKAELSRRGVHEGAHPRGGLEGLMGAVRRR